MRSIKGVLYLTAAITVAACSDRPEDAPPPPVTADSAAATPTVIQNAPGALPPSRDTTVRTGIVGAPSASFSVVVEISEESARVSHSTVPAGQSTFTLNNTGTQRHSLEISAALGGRWRTAPVAPGQPASVTMVLSAGTYEAYCPMSHNGQPHRSKAVTQFVIQ